MQLNLPDFKTAPLLLSAKTDRTPEQIRATIDACMNMNRRKQTFQVIVRKQGEEVIVAPEAYGYIGTDRPNDWTGYGFIQRHAWENVPGFAERLCNDLSAKMALPEWARQ